MWRPRWQASLETNLSALLPKLQGLNPQDQASDLAKISKHKPTHGSSESLQVPVFTEEANDATQILSGQTQSNQASASSKRKRGRPFPLNFWQSRAGAIIYYEPFDGRLSGMIHRQPNGRVVIGVNSSHAPTRQRFTIAHELGHLLLHKEELLHVDESASIRFRDEESSLATKADEIEANQVCIGALNASAPGVERN